MNEFNNLKKITSKELKEAKSHLEGQFILDNEDTQDRADELCYWAAVKDVKLFDNYLKVIRKVSLKDISRVSKKYFTKNYTLAVIEQS